MFNRVFQNPFRLIHEVYVHSVWANNWRKQHPEYHQAVERNQRNVSTLIIQLYVVIAIVSIAIAILMFVHGNYEIVRVVNHPVGIEA